MKRNINIRAVVRNTKFSINGKKHNFKKIIGSNLLTMLYKNSVFMGKRPRMFNWFYGRNKF